MLHRPVVRTPDFFGQACGATDRVRFTYGHAMRESDRFQLRAFCGDKLWGNDCVMIGPPNPGTIAVLSWVVGLFVPSAVGMAGRRFANFF